MKTQTMPEDDERWLEYMVPAVEAGRATYRTERGESRELAFVHLDVSGRPDVADLARVFQVEGIGKRDKHPPPRYLMGPEVGLLEHFRFTDPVICEFTFFVPWENNRAFFEAAIESGMMVLIFKGGLNDAAETLPLRINAPELAHVVQIWRETESEQ